MDTNQEKKKTPEVQLICFECKIKTTKGEIKDVYINLPPVVEKGHKGYYQDDIGNMFEYCTIYYENKSYTPNVDFELFKEDEGKFSDNYKLAYWKTLKYITAEINAEEDLKLAIKNFKTSQTKDLFKQQLIDLKILYPPYFEEFNKIYVENVQDMKSVSDKEKQFLRSFGFRKITRFSSFLLLLYRNKDNKDFLFDFDLSNEDLIKDIYDNFISSFKQRKKS